MKHWSVPGVFTDTPKSLPRAKNLSREAEHHCGTSKRDPIAFSYFHVKGLIKLPDALQNYLYTHAFRIIFQRLENSSMPNYQNLGYNERLDLALNEKIISQSIRSLLFQIEFEKNPIKLISVFLNFLKEIQESPLEFQPIFSQLSSDAEIFERDEEAQRLNKNYIRVL